MNYRILYEPFKTLEEQDQAEQKLKAHAELIAAIEGKVETMPLKPYDN